MATSQELYAQRNKLIEAKGELNSNVGKFISICDEALSKAKSIIEECQSCNDTNIKTSASGGCIHSFSDNITNLKSNVNSELAIANDKIQAEIDELGRQAADAAAREAAIAQAKAQQKTKVAAAKSNNTYNNSNISVTTRA